MSIVESDGWLARTTSDRYNTGKDKFLSGLMNAATLKLAIARVAENLVTCATDQHLQEFANRALTDVGFNLEIWKGYHFDARRRRKDTSHYFKEAHFSVRAASSVETPNPGTSGIIYHITCAVGMPVKKKSNMLITHIAYRKSGKDHEFPLVNVRSKFV